MPLSEYDMEVFLENLAMTLDRLKGEIEEKQPMFDHRSKNVNFAKDNQLFFSDAEATEKTAITINTDYHSVGAYGRFAVVVYCMGKSCAFGLFDETADVCLIMADYEIASLYWPDNRQLDLRERYNNAQRLTEEIVKLSLKAPH